MQDPMWAQFSLIVSSRMDGEQAAVPQLQEAASPYLIMLMIIFPLLFSYHTFFFLNTLKKTQTINYSFQKR
jgi:hypothetical protein